MVVVVEVWITVMAVMVLLEHLESFGVLEGHSHPLILVMYSDL
jgi:hypothetical protein